MRGRSGPYLVALAAGCGLSFAFPRPDLGALAWVTVAPLLVVARGARAGRGFRLGLLFGIGFFGLLILWISIIGWVAWAVLVLLQALFLGLFGFAWAVISRRISGGLAAVAAAILWTALEWARSIAPLHGFTWGELAQSQHDLPWMLRTAGWGGGWAVAWLLVLVNGLVAEAWSTYRLRGVSARVVGPAVIAALLLAAPLALPQERSHGHPLRVAIVQGNVPQHFSGSFAAKNEVILKSHLRLTRRLGELANPPALVVWPESSVGSDLERTPGVKEAIARAARAAGATIIAGGNLDLPRGRYKVMAFQFSPQGKLVDTYQKTHLVPFGEYVPGRRFLEWIPQLAQVPRDAVAGSEPTVFDVNGVPVAPVLSYEGDFGALVRQRIEAGARLLVVGTNTSTWGRSAASLQHVAFSQVRAAENGVWVVHAALSGVSAFIAPDGTVTQSTALGRATSLVGEVRPASGTTFYTRTGDWVPHGCAALSAVGLALSIVLGRKRTRSRTTAREASETRNLPVG